MGWTQQEAEHLLRRATLGGSQADVKAILALGQEEAISALLEYADVPDPVWAEPNPLGFDDPELLARRTLLYKLITSTRPLQARLLWFWQGHFTSTFHQTSMTFVDRQVQTWRRYAIGNFLEFLLAMYKDAAMLQYLDGDINTKHKPNENFARENFELFTMGAGTFSESDVREAARAFTGLVIGTDKEVTLDPSLHDDGLKTILGQRAAFNGDDVMRLIFNRPETSRHVCTKLYRNFVSEKIDPVELETLVGAWKAGGGNIKLVIRALLQLSGFWSPANRTHLIKGPLQFAVGLARRLELDVSRYLVDRIVVGLEDMGYHLWSPSTPSGYAMGARTLGSSKMLARFQFAYHCIYERSRPSVISAMTSGLPSTVPADQFPMRVASRLGLPFVASPTQEAIREYLGPEDITRTNLASKTLATTYLLACSPEYQLA